MVHAYKRALRGTAVLGILLASLSAKGTAQWLPLPSVGEARVATHAAVVNGKLYMWDGTLGSNALSFQYAEAEQAARSLDLATGTSWANIPNLPTSLVGGVTGVVNGKIYITGGLAVNVSGQTAEINAQTFVFDPANSSMSTKPSSMPTPVIGAASFVMNNKLYVVGGLSAQAYTNLVQVYNPATDSWEQLNNAAPFSGAFMATTVVGNDIYMIGGYRTSGTSLTLTNAAYKGTVSGQTVTWTPIANYPTPLAKASAGTLDGKVIVAAGETTQGGIASVNSYDPATNKWTPSYGLPVGTFHAAPLMSNGNSLIFVGGAENPNAYRLTTGAPKAIAVVVPNEITISVEKGSSGQGQLIVANNGVIDLNGTIEIPADAQSWLSVDQSNVTVAPTKGTIFTLTGNAATLEPNMYKTTINVKSNDASNATIPVTVRLFVADKLMAQGTNVVVEEATGEWCGWCPYGHDVLEQLKESHPDDLIILSYHGGSQTEPMQISEGVSLINKLGGTDFPGFPSAAIQRWLFRGEKSRMVNRGAWETYVNGVLTAQPNAPAAFELESYNFDAATRKVTARVKITTAAAIALPPGSNLRLTTVVSEDSISYAQTLYTQQQDGSVKTSKLSPYYHMDVVRQVYPNSNGEEIVMGDDAMTENFVLPGKTFTQDIEFTVPSAVKPNRSQIVFIVHRFDNGVLGDALQAFERPLVGKVSNTAGFAVDIAGGATKTIQVNDTAKFQTTISNTGNVAITVTPSRIANTLPGSGWQSWFCVSGSNCTLPDDNSGDPITIQPGATATVVVKVFGPTEGQAKVSLRFNGGDQQIDKEYTVNASSANSVDENVVTGSSLRLSQNVPNPASGVTRFVYNLASASSVTAEVFTLTGEKVMTVLDGRANAGENTLDVNVAGLPSGVYTMRLTAGSSTVTRMMTVAH